MKEFISKHKILLVFTIFFLFVLFQHHFMWLYHDDYGYASLSYVGTVYQDHYAGYHTSLADIFKFLGFHYNNWGGRILCFFFECTMLSFGMHVFRVVQSLVITLIFYLIYKIVAHVTKKEDVKLAILSCLLYGVFEIMLFRNSVFWLSASILYIFPMLPFFMFIYFYVLKNEKTKKMLFTILCGIIVFFASFSQEQISIMTVSFLVLYIGYKYFTTKKFEKKDIVMLVIAIIGFAILMLAPGSQVRMQHVSSAWFYELRFLDKLKLNIPSIIQTNFGGYTRIFTLLFFSTVSYISYKNLENSKKKLKYLDIASLISSLSILCISFYKYDGYFSSLYNYNNNSYGIFWIILFVLQLALVLYSLTIYFFKNKNPIIVGLIWSAVASQGAMILVPSFQLRSAMIFQFIMFIVIIYVFYELSKKLKKNTWIIMIPIAIILVFNYTEITYGYMKNNKVNSSNHTKLIKASKDIKAGKKIKKIVLKELPDIAYSSDQPYIGVFYYITTYMKAYYQIPMDVVIEYKK